MEIFKINIEANEIVDKAYIPTYTRLERLRTGRVAVFRRFRETVPSSVSTVIVDGVKCIWELVRGN